MCQSELPHASLCFGSGTTGRKLAAALQQKNKRKGKKKKHGAGALNENEVALLKHFQK